MVIIGLTGSIGMGKTTAARLLRHRRVPVHDADATVHRLLARGGRAIAPINRAFPGVVQDGAVDRQKLGTQVFGDPGALRRLEAIVHPLVRADIRSFLAQWGRFGAQAVVLDVPLLLESGWWARCDLIAVVSAPWVLQRQRVLARPGMTENRLRHVLSCQMPDAEKRRRADIVIPSGLGLGVTWRALDGLMRLVAQTEPTHWPFNPYRESRDARNRSGY